MNIILIIIIHLNSNGLFYAETLTAQSASSHFTFPLNGPAGNIKLPLHFPEIMQTSSVIAEKHQIPARQFCRDPGRVIRRTNKYPVQPLLRSQPRPTTKSAILLLAMNG